MSQVTLSDGDKFGGDAGEANRPDGFERRQRVLPDPPADNLTLVYPGDREQDSVPRIRDYEREGYCEDCHARVTVSPDDQRQYGHQTWCDDATDRGGIA